MAAFRGELYIRRARGYWMCSSPPITKSAGTSDPQPSTAFHHWDKVRQRPRQGGKELATRSTSGQPSVTTGYNLVNHDVYRFWSEQM
jgi:hypothetical protein